MEPVAHRAAPCVWLTGRRGAGKRTIGALVAASLRAEGTPCAVLDAEVLTRHLARGPGEGGLASLAWLAELLSGNGVTVMVTVDAPLRDDREALRRTIAGFVEVFVDAPAELCTERSGTADPAYEAPISPDLRVPTDDRDARASAAQLVSYLEALTEPTGPEPP